MAVYQSRESRILGWGFASFGVIACIAMVVASKHFSTAVAALTLWGIYVPIVLRYGRARVQTSDNGVFVANVFSNEFFSWEEIQTFRMGSWRIFRSVCLVVLQDGSAKHAFGIQENIPNGQAKEMASEMNAELEKRRNGH